MVVKSIGMWALPNELFIQILSSFSTQVLLPIAPVSHRFHDIILHILHHRLHAAVSLVGYKLIFESYHPSAKLSTPGLTCVYLGTNGLDDIFDSLGSLYADVDRVQRFSQLADLYSHFRPLAFQPTRRPQQSRLADVPNQIDVTGMMQGLPEEKVLLPSETLSLESHELFTQLCTNVILVKNGPKHGFFSSCIAVDDGVIRVWRHWLAEQADLTLHGNIACTSLIPGLTTEMSEDQQNRILWLDNEKSVGVKLRVVEREDLRTHALIGVDEDPHVTYIIEYEEVVIKTTRLLLKVEESLKREAQNSGKYCGDDEIYVDLVVMGDLAVHYGVQSRSGASGSYS